jgi:ACS family glucarate transporter-like MFS transporter
VTRYLVVAGLFALSLITYIDRAAISSAKGPISTEMSFDDQAMGAVFGAFALGYALAQIPSGWFADRAGPRLMLTAVVTAWSLLTAATGSVTSYLWMLVVRFLFGAAEAGAFPGSARAIYNWLPGSERGRANGIIFSASRLGAALAFPLMDWMLRNWNWRVSFYLLAIPGFAWALLWALWFRNEPAVAPPREDAVAAEELSFAQIFRSGPMVLAMAQYFFTNFTTFLALSWMLPYLRDRYQLSSTQAAAYAMLPLLFGAASQWATGFMVDRLYLSRFRSWSRALPAITGFALSASGLIAVTGAASAEVAVVCFVAAAFGADMTISPSWAYCMDIAGRRSGALTGSMNMMGNLGSFVSANAFPFLFRATGSASAYFLMTAALSVAGMLCWVRMRSLLASRQTALV